MPRFDFLRRWTRRPDKPDQPWSAEPQPYSQTVGELSRDTVLQAAIDQARFGFEDSVVRPPCDWRPPDTCLPGRLRLDAARHLYALYPVPAHLEEVWLGDNPGSVQAMRKRYYLAVAQGRSLYDEGRRWADKHRWLTRAEVHRLTTMTGVASFDRAFWASVALGYTDYTDVALRFGQTKLAHQHWPDMPWLREVVRFFCDQPTTVEEMDDLFDFFSSRREREPGFRLTGRTLSAARVQMEAWHRDLAAVHRLADDDWRDGYGFNRAEDVRWDGLDLGDWRLSVADEVYLVRQLTSAVDLVDEGAAMGHCVATYAAGCLRGATSVWSLRRRAGNAEKRLLTVEVDRRYRVVQVRGRANRLATPAEWAVLRRWADERGLTLLV